MTGGTASGAGQDRALDALRVTWGQTFDLGFADGAYWAARLDGTGDLLRSATPDVLAAALSADRGGRGHPVSSRGPSATPAAADQVARWEQVKFQFPQASYSAGGDGWFYGALRDEDTPLRAASLERLIGALLAREPGEGR